MSFLFVVWFLFLPFVGYHLANIRIIVKRKGIIADYLPIFMKTKQFIMRLGT